MGKKLLTGKKGLDAFLIVAVLGMVATLVLGLGYKAYYNKMLEKNGVEVNAKIMGKERLKTSKGKTKSYTVQLAVFAEDKTPETNQPNTDSQNFDDKLDALFEKNKPASIGEYTSVRKTISGGLWANLNEGDWVRYRYLENEINNGKIIIKN